MSYKIKLDRINRAEHLCEKMAQLLARLGKQHPDYPEISKTLTDKIEEMHSMTHDMFHPVAESDPLTTESLIQNFLEDQNIKAQITPAHLYSFANWIRQKYLN